MRGRHPSKRNKNARQSGDASQVDRRGVGAGGAVAPLLIAFIAACGGKTQAAPPDHYQWDAAANVPSDAGVSSDIRESAATTVTYPSTSATTAHAPVTSATTAPYTTPTSTTTSTTVLTTTERWDSTSAPDTPDWPHTTEWLDRESGDDTTETWATVTTEPGTWEPGTPTTSEPGESTNEVGPTTLTTERGETTAVDDGSTDEPPSASASPSVTSTAHDVTLEPFPSVSDTVGSPDDTSARAETVGLPADTTEPTAEEQASDAGLADASVHED